MPVPPIQSQKQNTARKLPIYKNPVSWSGYAALGFGTICGATGFKKVKFPHKRNIHKVSAYLAGITSFLHFGFVKGLDKKLLGKNLIDRSHCEE